MNLKSAAMNPILVGVPKDKSGPQIAVADKRARAHPAISPYQSTLVLISAFIINFTAYGLLFSFGVYQAHYKSLALIEGTPFSGASSATIDLIGTLSAAFMTIGAPLAVGWAKNFRPWAVAFVGGVIYGVACVAASFGKELWHFQLSQGLLLGIGTYLSFIPSMTVAPTWFDQHRGLAMGVISAGTGVGGLIWAPVITTCIQHMGAVFIAQALSSVFQSAANYTPVFFTVAYAKSIGYDDDQGANLTAVSNACNTIGKIAIRFVADRVGRVNAFFLSTFFSVVATLAFWVSSTVIGSTHEVAARGLFVTFTVLYGLLASAYISLFSAVLMELFGADQLPRVAGVIYMTQGLSALVGTPVAGLLVQGQASRDPGAYVGMASFVGALLFCASAAIAWVRVGLARKRNSALA
ncbi:hypothetical protein CBER1_10780 [Cercospora berteroae]|uniref:Major facilitator superfamily (MFS) profile domain-containing protein n=1 Tax=Cercospora berteroae TaxID=357750 RepID=A0A2S6CF67_9PEZI|nr:hypothetical protein CBER1_10780 [Cercospora berteroae]